MLYLIFSCQKSRKNYSTITGFNSKIDTIYGLSPNNLNCKKKSERFTKKFGSLISDYYVISSQERTKQGDSIAIAEPYFLNDDEISKCYSEEARKKLLIIYNSHSSKTHVYRNTHFIDEPNIFQEIKVTNSGFLISYELGNSSKNFVKTYISNSKIDSVNIESWGFKQYNKTYMPKDLSLQKYNVKILDSLINLKNH